MSALHTALGYGARRTGQKTIYLNHSQHAEPLAEIVIDPRTGMTAIFTPSGGPVELAEPDLDKLIERIAHLTPGRTVTLPRTDISVTCTQAEDLVLRHGTARATISRKGASRIGEALARTRDILSGARAA